jgi:hypothetical protein
LDVRVMARSGAANSQKSYPQASELYLARFDKLAVHVRTNLRRDRLIR